MPQDMEAKAPGAGPLVPVKVWDPGVRIFHWAAVILVGVCWWSVENGRMDIHTKAGQVLLALVLFRILWGFLGRGTARFGDFVRGPRQVFGYLGRVATRTASHSVGHNPLGALSVLALIAVLLLQTVTGMLAIDTDQEYSGPLNGLVSYETGRLAARVHGWAFTALQLLVAIHVVVVLLYLVWKRENLIGAMVTGKAHLPAGTRAPALAGAGRALLIGLIAAGLVWLVANYGVRAWIALTPA